MVQHPAFSAHVKKGLKIHKNTGTPPKTPRTHQGTNTYTHIHKWGLYTSHFTLHDAFQNPHKILSKHSSIPYTSILHPSTLSSKTFLPPITAPSPPARASCTLSPSNSSGFASGLVRLLPSPLPPSPPPGPTAQTPGLTYASPPGQRLLRRRQHLGLMAPRPARRAPCAGGRAPRRFATSAG